jgi:hypothetical protein
MHFSLSFPNQLKLLVSARHKTASAFKVKHTYQAIILQPV